ncbi:MAG: hypothetical protein IJT56_01580 [Clostridia bacterium]|nr:hypothetical protein [Clostridia bacterium]
MMRKSSLLLSALLLFGMLMSCGEAASSPKPGVTAAPDTAEAATEPEETDPLSYLPDKDFGGRTFTILTRNSMEYEFLAEEQTGDIINDAVYERNHAIEDRYNVKINLVAKETTWGGGDKFNSELDASIMAGDSDYDMVAGYAAMILGAVQQGLFVNWYDVPHIDITKPWWSPQIADSLTINGRMYAMTGDIALSIWEGMVCMYYNKKLADSYSTGDVYQTVKDGSWTFDRFLSVVSKVSGDLDGDTKYTDADLYGYVSSYSTPIDSFMPAFDIQVVKRGDDGWLYYTINSEKTVSALEKMKALFFSGDNFALTNGTSDFRKIFKEDRSLFYAADLRQSANLRDMETDYGIVPYPKFDDLQEKYYSTSTDGFSLILFPSTVKDTEFVGLITEALCSVSSSVIIPTYYDVALKDKYNRDSQSSEMLDIIRDSLIYDVGYLNSFALDTAGHLFVQLVREGKTDFASAYAKKEKTFQKRLDKMLEAYGDAE